MEPKKQYNESEKIVLTLDELVQKTPSEERREELNDIKQKILIKVKEIKEYEK